MSALRKLRTAAGMSQAALSAASGVPSSTISAIERFNRTPTAHVAHRLAVALDVDPDRIAPVRRGALGEAACALREARARLGITQGEAARRIGVSRSTYENWEGGHHKPSDRFHARIREVLGERALPPPKPPREPDLDSVPADQRLPCVHQGCTRLCVGPWCDLHTWPIPPPDIIPHRPAADWRARAACLGMDVEMFYPREGRRPADDVVDACRDCPVRPDCLADALAEHTQDGVRGGMGAGDRVVLNASMHLSGAGPVTATVTDDEPARAAVRRRGAA